jgi:hypothetical protein
MQSLKLVSLSLCFCCQCGMRTVSRHHLEFFIVNALVPFVFCFAPPFHFSLCSQPEAHYVSLEEILEQLRKRHRPSKDYDRACVIIWDACRTVEDNGERNVAQPALAIPPGCCVMFATKSGRKAHFSREPQDASLFAKAFLAHSNHTESFHQPHALFFGEMAKCTETAARLLDIPYDQQPEMTGNLYINVVLRPG